MHLYRIAFYAYDLLFIEKFEKSVDFIDVDPAGRRLVMHRDDYIGHQEIHVLFRLFGIDGIVPSDRLHKHVYGTDGIAQSDRAFFPDVAQMAEVYAVHPVFEDKVFPSSLSAVGVVIAQKR